MESIAKRGQETVEAKEKERRSTKTKTKTTAQGAVALAGTSRMWTSQGQGKSIVQ